MIWLGIVFLQMAASALETSLGGPWLRGHVWIDLTSGVVVYLALFRGRRAGAVAGFLGGLFADFAGAGLIGVSSLLLLWVGYLVGRAGERMPRENPLVQGVLITLTVFARQLVILATSPGRFPEGGALVVPFYALPTAVASAFAAMAAYRVTARLGGNRVR